MKATIRENGKPHMKNPLAIITMNTEASIVDYWIAQLCDNPNRYIVEVDFSFVFSETSAKAFHDVYGALLCAYQSKSVISLTPEQIMASFFGALQAFAFAEMHDEREREESDKY